MELEIPTARVFVPFLKPSRYKACWGGRGSGKSHFFAEAAVEHCVMHPGTRIVCVREIQRSLNESAKRLIEDKIDALQVPGFRKLHDRTETPGGGVIVYQGMRDHTADTIKSFEGFDLAWVEEASSLSAKSLQLLRPTIRNAGSELWFSWNPRRQADPVDQFFRGPHCPEGTIMVRANWDQNPWFPPELEAERQHDLAYSPSYRHVWEGEYATVVEGAYFAQGITQAMQEGRVTALTIDPLVELRAFWDIGVEDSMAIWIAQFSRRRVDVLDYMEGQGQSLAYYVNWLRSNGYENALCVLPHDGARRGMADALSFSQHIQDAGFRTKVVRNQGKGAAVLRIEALRRLFPRMWFDEVKCAAGLEALGAYHERRDDTRRIGLGPEHDWASHGADAAGLLAICYEEPKTMINRDVNVDRIIIGSEGDSSGGWMAS